MLLVAHDHAPISCLSLQHPHAPAVWVVVLLHDWPVTTQLCFALLRAWRLQWCFPQWQYLYTEVRSHQRGKVCFLALLAPRVLCQLFFVFCSVHLQLGSVL